MACKTLYIALRLPPLSWYSSRKFADYLPEPEPEHESYCRIPSEIWGALVCMCRMYRSVHRDVPNVFVCIRMCARACHRHIPNDPTQTYRHTLRESIPRLFNGRRTSLTTHCAPACNQVPPVKHQVVWARGVEAWARSRDLLIWSFGGGSLQCPPS